LPQEDGVKPTIARLDSTTASALLGLMPHVWVQDWDSDFFPETFRWRYLDKPSDGGTWLALDGRRCVAVLDSYLRPYLLEGRRILMREPCDWFCLPNYRRFGLGLKLMCLMMDEPEPIITVGPTNEGLSIMAPLGWQRLSDVQRMVLPVTLRSLAGNALRRRGARYAKYARAIPGFVPVRSPRIVPPPAAAARIEEWRPGQKLSIPIPQRNGLLELLELADLEWICGAPSRFIRPIVLVFLFGCEPVGLSLSQLEPSATGPDARIVHLQISDPSQPVTDWIVSETARRLAQAGAGVIRCRASTPQKVTALKKTGFIAAPAQSTYWWAKDGTPAPSIIDIGYLRASDALPFDAAATLRVH
jgi:hypothetical protein